MTEYLNEIENAEQPVLDPIAWDVKLRHRLPPVNLRLIERNGDRVTTIDAVRSRQMAKDAVVLCELRRIGGN